MLDLQIRSDDVTLTGEVDEYVRLRAQRLDTFHPKIGTCRVVIEAPTRHHRQGGPYEVRIDLDVPGTVITVNHQRAEDLHAAVRQAFDAAQRQLEDHARQVRHDESPSVAPPRGTVIRLFNVEGYGFLRAEDGHEVYFHRNAVLGARGFDGLRIGDELRYNEEMGDNGPQASTVAVPGV